MPTYDKFKNTVRRLFRRPRKVGIAFGGGNSRGAAHAGVLKVLVENKIPIDYISATSSGAIVGALFAYGLNVYDICKIAESSNWLATITRIKFDGIWPISEAGLEEFMRKYVGNKNANDLRIPFAAVATDYETGKKIVLNKGNLARIVHASSAVPGLFAPVEFEGRLLMDGLMVDNVPADVAREMGADYVIAVDVVPDLVIKEKPKNIRQVVERAIDIASIEQSSKTCKYADIVINPVIDNISPLDFSQGKHLILEGENAALKVVNKIKNDLGIQ